MINSDKIIGIMGGTFNPIHKGHTGIARCAYEQSDIDEILFMPSGTPAYKDNSPIVSATDRCNMVNVNFSKAKCPTCGKKVSLRVISRINFCTIPEREIGAEMTVYGEYDDAFREALKPYIENLCKASGRIDCDEASILVKHLFLKAWNTLLFVCHL